MRVEEKIGGGEQKSIYLIKSKSADTEECYFTGEGDRCTPRGYYLGDWGEAMTYTKWEDAQSWIDRHDGWGVIEEWACVPTVEVSHGAKTPQAAPAQDANASPPTAVGSTGLVEPKPSLLKRIWTWVINDMAKSGRGPGGECSPF